MNLKSIAKKFSRFNIFILAVLLLLGFSLLYFLYYRQRSRSDVFVTVSLLRPQNMPVSAPFNWVPYWIGEAIEIGDKEISPLGGLNATVIDKETYEGPAYGQYVYLLMKVRAIKDRSGVYLFKNKPLSAGGVVDLKLTKTQIQGLVTYIGQDLPQYEYKLITLTVKGREMEPWYAENLKIGSTIVNKKGTTLAKVVDKKANPAEVRADTAGGSAVISYDKRKRDFEIIIEILVKKLDDTFYFAETQKVKVNESLFLPFPEIGNLTLPITSIIQVKDSL